MAENTRNNSPHIINQGIQLNNNLNAYKVEFPEFNGVNPLNWISKANRFFELNPNENRKVLHAGYYMVGVADTWYTEYIEEKGRLDMDWECFCVKMLQHFTTPEKKNEMRKDGSSSPDSVIDNPLSQDPDSIWGCFFRNAELEKMIDQESTRLYLDKASWKDALGLPDRSIQYHSSIDSLFGVNLDDYSNRFLQNRGFDHSVARTSLSPQSQKGKLLTDNGIGTEFASDAPSYLNIRLLAESLFYGSHNGYLSEGNGSCSSPNMVVSRYNDKSALNFQSPLPNARSTLSTRVRVSQEGNEKCFDEDGLIIHGGFHVPAFQDNHISSPRKYCSISQAQGYIYHMEKDQNGYRFLQRKFEEGTLSPDNCQMTGLWYFDVRGNNLTGTIPENIGNCTSFEILDISYNQITGKIPDVIGLMQALAVLDLSENQLVREIPLILGNLSYTGMLYLHGNMFAGRIPPEFGKWEQLFELNLANNNSKGPIHENISSCTALNQLNVHGNRLNGTLPSALTRLESLTYLNLSSNQFSGNIANELGHIINLDTLDNSNNEFVLKGSEISSNADNKDFSYSEKQLLVKKEQPSIESEISMHISTKSASEIEEESLAFSLETFTLTDDTVKLEKENSSKEIITDTFEAARKPLVAAIDGLAFGSGLEIGLACHARISTSIAQLGLTELQYEIIPGISDMNLQPRKINKVPVVGGGFRSSRVVVMLLLKSYQVILKEKNSDRLFHEIKKIKGNLQNHVIKGNETQERIEKAFKLLELVTSCFLVWDPGGGQSGKSQP